VSWTRGDRGRRIWESFKARSGLVCVRRFVRDIFFFRYGLYCSWCVVCVCVVVVVMIFVGVAPCVE